ncbi:hypothetical protein DFH06DRAFT_1124362 [Mycena polygramma]|nr:hypothetical protein DFH06DRAFT_1124362 [Mycena polygramma]
MYTGDPVERIRQDPKALPPSRFGNKLIAGVIVSRCRLPLTPSHASATRPPPPFCGTEFSPASPKPPPYSITSYQTLLVAVDGSITAIDWTCSLKYSLSNIYSRAIWDLSWNRKCYPICTHYPLSLLLRLRSTTRPLRPIIMVASQTNGFRMIAYHGPPSPLAAKSRRFQVANMTPLPLPLPPIPNPPYCFNSMDEVVDRQPTPMMPTFTPPPQSSSTPTAQRATQPDGAGLKASYDALEAESQVVRQTFVKKNQDGKATGGTYERHYKNYNGWFDDREARKAQQNPSYTPIPSLPITVAKVTGFVHSEMTRPKKTKLPDGTPSTSTCGQEHAKQVISALEHFRFNSQHLYRDIPEAQVNLRSDSRIKTLEAAFAHNEPERVKKAHSLKAAGTRADTYTDTQLSTLATSGILETKGPTAI